MSGDHISPDAPELPPFCLRRPPLPADPAAAAQAEDLWTAITTTPGIVDLTEALPSPRWPVLAYLAEHKPVLLHGSNDATITELVPRQSHDTEAFGNQYAVYAASDGIWPIFFAIVDRSQRPLSLHNACFRTELPGGALSDPAYFFSLNREAWERAPWRTGTVYLLPRDGFELRPPERLRGRMTQPLEWASPAAVTPLAAVSVGPADFPFLAEIRRHDMRVLSERAEADPDGFPWVTATDP
ncbi:MAG TPA: hypothetical protein VD886_13945 [Herpetosiphonaceae bacterium]|nr:hypothetical protein [Herpetosiphonaceae bacterium]